MARQQITLGLDADIIAWFKAEASGGGRYQTDINGALREHVHRTARSARWCEVPRRTPMV